MREEPRWSTGFGADMGLKDVSIKCSVKKEQAVKHIYRRKYSGGRSEDRVPFGVAV